MNISINSTVFALSKIDIVIADNHNSKSKLVAEIMQSYLAKMSKSQVFKIVENKLKKHLMIKNAML